MPPLLAAEHLVTRLFEVGPTGGEEPLSFREMEAFTAMTGTTLTAWESQTLRALSSIYLAMSHKAIEPDCPPPYAPGRPLTRKQVSDKLSAMFDRLERQQVKEARRMRAKPSP